jgi:hypothetical protein
LQISRGLLENFVRQLVSLHSASAFSFQFSVFKGGASAPLFFFPLGGEKWLC